MSRADSKDSIICKLIDGGQKAVKSYKKISGSDWFDGAPEYFLTTFVGKNLEKLENTWVVFEVSVKDVKDYAKAKGRGRPSSHERKNGRFDIVLY